MQKLMGTLVQRYLNTQEKHLTGEAVTMEDIDSLRNDMTEMIYTQVKPLLSMLYKKPMKTSSKQKKVRSIDRFSPQPDDYDDVGHGMETPKRSLAFLDDGETPIQPQTASLLYQRSQHDQSQHHFRRHAKTAVKPKVKAIDRFKHRTGMS